MKTFTTSLSQSNKVVILLAAIPTLDCILNQVNNAFQVSFSGFSLLQVVRGYMVLIFISITAWFLAKDSSGFRRTPLPAIGAILLIGIWSSKELMISGSLAMPSVGAYGQMAYWITLWLATAVVCKEIRQTEIILKGLALGALCTAGSVLIGYAFGGLNPYADDGVSASAGWFNTAKTITGVLVTGGVVFLYLGRSLKSWLPPLLASVCFAACVLTYARAGFVALIVVLSWLLVWWSTIGRGETRQWLSRFLILLFAAALLAPALMKSNSMSARWEDIQDPDKAGSGRATFWRVAIDGYVDATPAEEVLGRGYYAMSELLYIGYGEDIKHTHNDMLDMLLVGGGFGAGWLMFMIGSALQKIGKSTLKTHEGAAGVAIMLVYLVHAQFTGQLFGTDSMTYYMLGLTCLSNLTTMRGRILLLANNKDPLYPTRVKAGVYFQC
jgi:hypothetical protein